jgi:hypothetical protein
MTKNLSLNLEYERSMVKTELPAGYSLQEVNFELKILRVGVAYKF